MELLNLWVFPVAMRETAFVSKAWCEQRWTLHSACAKKCSKFLKQRHLGPQIHMALVTTKSARCRTIQNHTKLQDCAEPRTSPRKRINEIMVKPLFSSWFRPQSSEAELMGWSLHFSTFGFREAVQGTVVFWMFFAFLGPSTIAPQRPFPAPQGKDGRSWASLRPAPVPPEIRQRRWWGSDFATMSQPTTIATRISDVSDGDKMGLNSDG